MPNCTAFTTTLLDSRTAPATVKRTDVRPGDVLHSMGARFLVLDAWASENPPFGPRQTLYVAALSHADTIGILTPWSMSLSADLARHEDVTVEAPAPDARRWWIAASLDDRRRFLSANGWRETGDCSACAPTPLDPARRAYVPCPVAREHAWNQIGFWKESRHRLEAPRSYFVLPVLADTWEDARAEARSICERLRTVGHL
ncbi:hypothetical protein [Streptomyces sp. NPDC093707]|uniref:hypothetical protein n=1 Tax=Streptomyces sp. NPDC093707 TaxID=3154984 RepID=UPI00344B2D43